MTKLIFSSEQCEYCMELKERVKEEGIKAQFVDINIYDKSWKDLVKLTGNHLVPMIVFCDEDKGDEFFIPNINFHSIEGAINILKQK